MIAHEGTRRIGNRRRNISLLDPLYHCLDRHRHKISIRSFRIDGFVYNLVPFVIRNPAVIHVNPHTFYCNIRSAACLSDRQDHIRIVFCYRLIDHMKRFMADRRDF